MRLEDADLLGYLRGIGLMGDWGARVEAPRGRSRNYVRRVLSDRGERWIVKQAQPDAPTPLGEADAAFRAECEHLFLALSAELTPRAATILPRLLHFDAAGRVLVLEDLGPGPDLEDALAEGHDVSGALERLGGLLGALQRTSRAHIRPLRDRLHNGLAQSQLAAHLFAEPDTSTELAELPDASRMPTRARLGRALQLLRSHFERRASALVHGDVRARNLLWRGDQLRLIDAEFAHAGDPAYDLGGALAPLERERALRPLDLAPRQADRALVRGYLHAGGRPQDLSRARAYAGAILLRELRVGSSAGRPDPPAATQALLERSVRLVLAALDLDSEHSAPAPAP